MSGCQVGAELKFKCILICSASSDCHDIEKGTSFLCTEKIYICFFTIIAGMTLPQIEKADAIPSLFAYL